MSNHAPQLGYFLDYSNGGFYEKILHGYGRQEREEMIRLFSMQISRLTDTNRNYNTINGLLLLLYRTLSGLIVTEFSGRPNAFPATNLKSECLLSRQSAQIEYNTLRGVKITSFSCEGLCCFRY